MKKGLLTAIFFLCVLSVDAQKDTIAVSQSTARRNFAREMTQINVNIYPVPVRENSFTIKSDKDISFVRITNIIGQDIYRAQYNNPLQITKIFLDSPKRGMYLVAILFSDGTRVVKKITIEESE